jgi:3-hydroxyacyl-CoA dehydrogenase
VSDVISYELKGRIAVITVNNPPVNALSHGVRKGLLDAFAKLNGDAGADAAVLVGGGRTFIAGADIREFGKPMQPPSLHEVLDQMEASTKPIVAAIHGTALGGGLEVALTCHWRVAVASAQVGLPEVKLGLLPGAGGTQRLPRLVGPKLAADMITTGNFVGAKAALASGVIDEIVDDLVGGAIAFAEKVVKEKRPLRKVSELTDKVTNVDPKLFADYRATLSKKVRGFLAPMHCLAAVEAACTLPFKDGMKRERELFQELHDHPQRAAQIHIFFAEREAQKIPDIGPDVKPKQIKSAAVIGAGTMGGGIAMNFANVGIPVKVLELDQAALDRGLGVVKKNYQTSVARGSTTQEAIDKALSLISGTTSYDDIADADIVIEAVFENMEIKKQVFAKLDQVMKPGAILASNTSTLDIDEIASATKRPQDVIGTHFFSPANVMKLLENVRGKASSKETIATVMELGKKIRKVPVLAGNCFGFIGNRMLHGYTREAAELLLEGAMPWDVDRVIYNFGLPMGPFQMSDLAGIDVGWRVRQGKGGPPEKHNRIADRLYEMGRYGQKTGAGYYKYDGRNASPDPEVEKLVIETSKEFGITRRKIDDEEILYRCMLPLVNVGAQILDEGIAIRSSDIDITYVYGYGFPSYRGGPMFWAEQMGLDKVLQMIRKYEQEHGSRWKPAPLLVKLVDAKKGWADAKKAA